MTGRPTQSREDSASSQPHRPTQPSTLRQSHTPPSRPGSDSSAQSEAVPSRSRNAVDGADESTPLIPSHGYSTSTAHPGACDHGTFSPRAGTPTNDSSQGFAGQDISQNTGSDSLEGLFSHTTSSDDWKQWLKSRMRTRKMGQSSELAERAGFRDTPLM